jgi:hypothetical protein
LPESKVSKKHLGVTNSSPHCYFIRLTDQNLGLAHSLSDPAWLTARFATRYSSFSVTLVLSRPWNQLPHRIV